MQNSPWVRRLLIATIFAGALYGASYQQFRFFDPQHSGGASDSGSYLKMARGEYEDLSIYHRYRFVVPLLAGGVRQLLPADHGTDVNHEVLAFYLVNFAFGYLSTILLFAVLKRFGMSDLLAMLGGLLFICNRITVMSTGTPLIDGATFTASIALVWLIERDQPLWLALAMPLLALTKETMLPLMLLPIFTQQRRYIIVWVGMAASIGFYFLARHWWTVYTGIQQINLAGETTSYAERLLIPNIKRLFTPGGIHDFFCGFTFLLPWAVIGYYLNRANNYFVIPKYLLMFIPISGGLAILNGNFGRVLQQAFPLVIPYALISIQAILVRAEKSENTGVEAPA